MQYIKYMKRLFGSLFTTNRLVDAATQRKRNRTGLTVRTCNHCGQKKNQKFFYKTTGNTCKKCHNKRTAAYAQSRNA